MMIVIVVADVVTFVSLISSSGISTTSTTAYTTTTSTPVDKDKGTFGKLFHYLNEMKKELELAQKQRREGQLENQRLREKCQQLDDRLATEQAKGTGIK